MGGFEIIAQCWNRNSLISYQKLGWPNSYIVWFNLAWDSSWAKIDSSHYPLFLRVNAALSLHAQTHIRSRTHTRLGKKKRPCVVVSKSKSKRQKYIRQRWGSCECSYSTRYLKSSPIIVAALSNNAAAIFLPSKRTNNFIHFKTLPRVIFFFFKTETTAFPRWGRWRWLCLR